MRRPSEKGPNRGALSRGMHLEGITECDRWARQLNDVARLWVKPARNQAPRMARRSCHGLLPAREGKFVLKYFMLRKAGRVVIPILRIRALERVRP